MNDERLAELAAVKLRALVAEHLGVDVDEPARLGGGASVTAADQGWIYFPAVGRGALGTALIWSSAQNCPAVNLIVDEGADALAHAAAGFADPAPVVWRAVERRLEPVAPREPVVQSPPGCAKEMALLTAAGLEVVADHGVWLGEINGLEVARVGEREGRCDIDIGVGAYDQFASAALTVDREPAAALDRVVAMVRPHRQAGAEPHPMGRLVRSRWLRAQLVRDPWLIGLDQLDPVPLVIPRPGLVESQPAAALGMRGLERILVVCTVGVDLGVAETAAGLHQVHDVDEVLVVVPDRDRHERVVAAVDRLAVPASVVTVEGEWND